MIRKIEKKHEFVKKIMKNVKKSTTWRKFFMGTWAPNQIAQLMFRYFPVVILRFFASAVLFDGVALSFFLRLRFRVFYDFWRFWPIPFFAPRAVTISSFEPLKRARIELFNGPKLVINCADGIEKRRERFRKIRFWAENMEFFENLKIFVFLEFRLVEKLIRSGQDLERSFTPFCNVFHQ